MEGFIGIFLLPLYPFIILFGSGTKQEKMADFMFFFGIIGCMAIMCTWMIFPLRGIGANEIHPLVGASVGIFSFIGGPLFLMGSLALASKINPNKGVQA
ncbi:MAG: hypothetical protein A2650_04780 [Candidatus Yanofskybacteria bacterium RIFCSPHIGHO2_01_FULL_41_53]|uniref:Uncharacterized protein n=1 Tax=Candidatus Yanofskybacteria bacterium RIFCSPHIGHO2_01_FULL_41_53 TaxID=1802663 RepID=A0A1F8ELW4_9BACT|nr:MAG: hypothetical protein A2650_04780 [Candidatus Yanofskybacteria bacterium RIFCSPHIGHO2_01_FULL_41_53]OGN24850.1 MAG: hypothetical protein A2916_04515 [Candidatus Yanofskybacteria bacterium RIFCSPLOWO2_01_FULL_41_67]OGN28993.1 MAG: hypothetical protein A3H54_03270 [Candidatus Yanofskybacteria bacterium RIFCSPLOWO2_02_FULL_41_13]